MSCYYQDNHITLYNKDCRRMTELQANSVQCVVTSPPYWGLRTYSGQQDLIWGDNHCEHEWTGQGLISDRRGVEVVQGKTRTTTRCYGGDTTRTWSEEHQKHYQDVFCSLCGAWKGAYGLEPTPELYVEHTIEILREIRRVLRKDGVCFLNLGDSYAGSWGSMSHDLKGKAKRAGTNERPPMSFVKSKRIPRGSGRWGGGNTPATGVLKPKDLCLIPFKVAIAAQEDGWWVRSGIIWNKPNPMPESVTDRPTESHEYILMLTQSGKSLYWTHRDSGGTREKPKADYRWVNQTTDEEVATEPTDWKVKIKCPECKATGTISVYLGLDIWQETKCPTCNGKRETQLWKRINLWKGHDYYWDQDAVRESQSLTTHSKGNSPRTTDRFAEKSDGSHKNWHEYTPQTDLPAGRNLRSVWEFPTQPYPEAHFAVFPEKLPELCIKAATPEAGCCSECGAPWERVFEKGNLVPDEPHYKPRGRDKPAELVKSAMTPAGSDKGHPNFHYEKQTLGWQPTCKCNADKVPSLVLDPFAGAGTTLWVAKKLNRKAVGYELSSEYCELALDRNRQQILELNV